MTQLPHIIYHNLILLSEKFYKKQALMFIKIIIS